ncbi:MAG: 30S ribosomal protein S12 methylthiotransferase RimO, partial [Nevskiales bacterium]
ITLRSTFIVGFPGETEQDFQLLLDWLAEAQLDRVGCFQYSPVEGAPANALPDAVLDEVKQERSERFMELQEKISARRLKRKVGKTLDALVDAVDGKQAVARSHADAPDIDGSVIIENGGTLRAGQIVKVKIKSADDYDLYGRLV